VSWTHFEYPHCRSHSCAGAYLRRHGLVELTDLGHVVYTALAEDGSALKKRGRHSEHLPAGRAVLINVVRCRRRQHNVVVWLTCGKLCGDGRAIDWLLVVEQCLSCARSEAAESPRRIACQKLSE